MPAVKPPYAKGARLSYRPAHVSPSASAAGNASDGTGEKNVTVVVSVDARKPAEIEAEVEAAAQTKASMPALRLFVLAVFAGAFIALGGSFFTIVMSDASLGFALQRVIGGLVFCLGLVLVLLCGAELFTGNSLMICALASRKIDVKGLLRNWGLVWIGNFVGALLVVALIFLANMQELGADGVVGNTMVSIAAGKVNLPWTTILARGVLCNVLVCLAVWIGFGARTAVDKVAGIILPISAFVVMGFEHCVANMFFLPMGILARAVGYGGEVAGAEALDGLGVLYNLSAATIGNLIGGVLLVGLGYWLAFGKKTQPAQEE